MTEKTRNKFEEYALLKVKIHELESQCKELAEKLMPMVEKEEDKQIKMDYGTFYIKPFVKYEYTKKLIEKELEIKQLKKKEQENGKAKKIETPTFVFTPARMTVPVGAYNLDK